MPDPTSQELVQNFKRDVGKLLEEYRSRRGADYLELGRAASKESGRAVHATGARDLCLANRWVWPPYARAIMVYLRIPHAAHLAEAYDAIQRFDGKTPRLT